MRGFRESEALTNCNFPTDLILVPFKVRDSSKYSDKTRPTWDQMQELAIEIRATPTLKSAGFCTEPESESEVANKDVATR
jgi:hypothetical protein